MNRVTAQVDIYVTSITAIMRDPDFRRGVEEYRARKRPAGFNSDADGTWNYERGRQFAAVAPHDLPITSRKARIIFQENIR